MTTKNKVLNLAYEMMHDLESDWSQRMEDMGIYDDISFIYMAEDINGDTRLGNIVFCYTILAYDNRSEMLNPHHDRVKNKVAILSKLDGLSVMTKPIFQQIVMNKNEDAFKLSEWYLKYQQDWRWSDIITNQEYHAMAQIMSKRGAVDAQDANYIGKMLETATARRKAADTLHDELKTEFMALDKALHAEDRPKISDLERNDNFMSFEQNLAQRKKLTAGS